MTRCASRRTAFTIVELLIVIAIILILGALVAVTLPVAKERTRRTSCLNNMRQFGLTFHLYGADNTDRLPSGYSEEGENQIARKETANIDEHVPVITSTVRSNLLQLSGSSKVFICPSLRAPFTRPEGWRFTTYGVLLGFNYLGGHYNSPWKSSSLPVESWVSPQKLTDDPQLLVLTDLNTFTVSDKASFIPHTAHGPLLVGGEIFGVIPDRKCPGVESPDDLHPARFGGAGGNVARLDGSISWRPMNQMKVHIGSSVLKENGALAVW
jgi:type II secretory pathway pseudopilin PulG